MRALSSEPTRLGRRVSISTAIFSISLVVSALAAFAIWGLRTPVTVAQEGAKFTVTAAVNDASAGPARSYFVLDGAPGTVLSGTVRVQNIGGAPGTVRLYPVDGATGQTSGVVMLMRQDPRRQIGTWVKLSASELTLQASEARDVPFTLTIPPDARQGEHIGGIIAEDAELRQARPGTSQADAAGFQIVVQNRVATSVELTVPGPAVEKLAINGVTPGGQRGYQTLLLGLQNDGDVRLKPHGTLQVFDARGNTIQDLGLKLDTFLPETAIEYPVFIQPPALAAGEYRATIVLEYGHGKEARFSTSFTVTPLQVAQVFGAQRALDAPVVAPAAVPVPSSIPTFMLVGLGLGCALGGMLLFWLVGQVRRRLRQSPARLAEPDVTSA